MLHLDANVIFKKDMSLKLLDAFKNTNYIQVLNKSNIDVIKAYCDNVPVAYIPNVVKITKQNKNYDKINNNTLQKTILTSPIG